MTKEELKNRITELKENCKKLAEEYRERYNQDNEDKIALNMFYHNVISYNDYESVLALFENRNPMIMCFSAPPVLTEETVEINLKRIAELEKENAELKTDYKVLSCSVDNFGKLQDELEEEQRKNNGLSDNLAKAKEHIENLLYYVKQCTCERSNYAEIEKDITEAEQFIKDSEVEK